MLTHFSLKFRSKYATEREEYLWTYSQLHEYRDVTRIRKCHNYMLFHFVQ